MRFKETAICLSGELGSKLKTEIIGEYYPFWWKIASGGKSNKFEKNTTIIEMDAGTGELHIEDSDEEILGSAGHALELKCSDKEKTKNLTLFLVEKNNECFSKLQLVLNKRWSSLQPEIGSDLEIQKKEKIYLVNADIEEALNLLDEISSLGNSLFFFDPLHYVKWSIINEVAKKRIRTPFETGTEFIIFNFTSDWFQGRDSINLNPLPNSAEKSKWSKNDKESIAKANQFFGFKGWEKDLLSIENEKQKQEKMIEIYGQRLLKWFRFVLPLPFSPKENQLYHIIFCSNYMTGIRQTRNYFSKKTGNPYYKPNNPKTYGIFKKIHTALEIKPGRKKPIEWLILWNVIKNSVGGIVDSHCRTLLEGSSISEKQSVLEFLENAGYLRKIENIEWAWEKDLQFPRYILNWTELKKAFNIYPPIQLRPLTTIKDK